MAQKIYVSPAGDDSNPGTKERPLLSFAKAQVVARKFSPAISVEVLFANGVYYLPGTIEFTAADAKVLPATVLYKAEEEGRAVISGGSLLHLQWKLYKNKIFVAEVSGNTNFIDQLFINGVRQRMARYPNAVLGKNVYDTWDLNHAAVADPATDALSPQRIAKWKNPAGAYIHAMHAYLWGDMHWIIKEKRNDTSLIYEGGWQNNRPATMHPLYRMVENIFEELDAPGEWYFDAKKHKLYYMPVPGTNLATAKVEIVRLRSLVELNGSREHPVKGVQLQGFVFRHSSRTFMDNKEPLLRSDWTVCRAGAIFCNGAKDCSVNDCEFDQLGGNSIFVNNYNRRITISGCYIHNTGANGIAFVGDPAMVRNPLFKYGKQDYKHLDHTPGPKGDNYPEDCLVTNCLITLTGRDEKQTAPVQISMSHKITISHCSIYEVPRAGINISEGTFGGHVIEYCDIFNTVLETGDHGSFNSWGRDRYWTPDATETSAEVTKDAALPSLDMMDPNVIHDNRWRCDHGWDIDLDDGSSFYRIYNNLLLNGGLKLREGYGPIASNNIIINNSLNPHDWYLNSGDQFKHNIVCTAYLPAIMDHTIPANGKWGAKLDSNFFVCDDEQMHRFIIHGCDSNSINGDPEFIDPSKGNFDTRQGSPVFKIGFVNFPMNQYGVTKPYLKTIAKTPEMPVINVTIPGTENTTAASFSWMGITLYEPRGNEMSAFGVGFDAGGVAFKTVTGNSAAYKAGFRESDLVQSIDGTAIKTIHDLANFMDKNKDEAVRHIFNLIRNQNKVTVTMDRLLHKVVQQ
ncbi:MAG: right-handed parallel beta-helix repeat-containing protein [Ginsengibacter sp.]